MSVYSVQSRPDRFSLSTTLAVPGNSMRGIHAFVGPKAHLIAVLLCRCLCARLNPSLVAPEHLLGLLEVANEEAGDKMDSAYLTAVLDLLVGCAGAAPALFADVGNQVS